MDFMTTDIEDPGIQDWGVQKDIDHQTPVHMGLG